MPRISVIMGVYNIADLPMFQEAMRSVLDQTFCDFEFIICDDGSTDGTPQLLKAYEASDSRIRIIRHEQNQGLAAALNRCLAAASGELIARQDADDLSTPDRLAIQAAFLDENLDIGFVGSHVLLYDENGVWGKRVFPEYPQRKDFLFTMPFVHGALMFRRAAYDRAGGYRVARETRRTEDYDMLMRMYAAGLRGANIPQTLYSFREDSASAERRKYRYRVDEAVVRWKGFCALHLMPAGIPYVLKPLAVGLIPGTILREMKKRWGIYK